LDDLRSLFKLVTDEPFVTSIIQFWNKYAKDYDKSVKTVTKALSHLAGAPINMSTTWPCSAFGYNLENAPHKIVSILRQAENFKRRTLEDIVLSAPSAPPNISMRNVTTQAKEFFHKILNTWKDRYITQANRYLHNKLQTRNLIVYQALVAAFDNIPYSLVMDTKNKYVIDGRNVTLKNMYSNYVRKRNITIVNISIADNIIDYGANIDNLLSVAPDVTFKSLGEVISKRYDMVYKDIQNFLTHGLQILTEDTLEDVYEIEKVKVEEPMDISKALAGFSFNFNAMPKIDKYQAAIHTYDSIEHATAIANRYGFETFRDWYDNDPIGCLYDEMEELNFAVREVYNRPQDLSEEENMELE